MNSINYIKLLLGIVAVVVIVGAVLSGFFIFRDHMAIKEDKILDLQKTVEIMDSYEVVTPLVPGSNLGIHNKIYVVHDNDRNVTCWLYDDGISCIPDRFLEEVEK